MLVNVTHERAQASGTHQMTIVKPIFCNLITQRLLVENQGFSGIMHSAETAFDINLAVGPISSAMPSQLQFSMQFGHTAASWVHDGILRYFGSIHCPKHLLITTLM